jgi:hypothetical protein
LFRSPFSQTVIYELRPFLDSRRCYDSEKSIEPPWLQPDP